MIKVKMFTKPQKGYMALEESINNWLEENRNILIKDVKIAAAPTTRVDLDSNIIMCIFYQEGD